MPSDVSDLRSETRMGDILATVEAWAARHPDKPLYVFLDVQGETVASFTYAGFLQRVEALAGHLAADPRLFARRPAVAGLSVRPGDDLRLLRLRPSVADPGSGASAGRPGVRRGALPHGACGDRLSGGGHTDRPRRTDARRRSGRRGKRFAPLARLDRHRGPAGAGAQAGRRDDPWSCCSCSTPPAPPAIPRG